MASGSYRNGALKASSRLSAVSAAPKPSPKPRLSAATPPAALRRTGSGNLAAKDGSGVPGRVRVAVRLRPRNNEELAADADFADCVELQPELKRLKLRKNNWDSDTFEFDEVLTESASQKRVYEVVAKPVVESVLEGYNGTVMAYGQTGTGKTFTVGSLGEGDTATRGIMVRAMEDILADTSPNTDTVSVSYLQLYMETIQDLLVPGNDNIAISEDPKTGDVSAPGATVVEIRNQKNFIELLRLGEAHRFAANTKLNTESSRSHAILMVHVKRSIKGRNDGEVDHLSENGNASSLVTSFRPPIVRKSKLVVVDLAGSERIDKSGSEGHTLEEAKSINLSLSALGKCINALAENSPHVPFRDSKLTRLLRDSFGGTARTSLVVTIGPSPRHRGETTSTIMFGQRAMKVENMVKLKEEFDYKSLCRRLDIELDKLIVENERQQKEFEDEVERVRAEAQSRIAEADRKYMISLESERMKYQQDYMESIKKLEEKWLMNQQISSNEACKIDHHGSEEICSRETPTTSTSNEIVEIKQLLEDEKLLRQYTEDEVNNLKSELLHWKKLEAAGNAEIIKLRKMLESEIHQKEELEEEITILKSQLLQLSFEADELSFHQTRRSLDQGPGKIFSGLDSLMSQARHSQLRDSGNGQKASIAKLFEQVGLQKILSLLESEDPDVRVHAVKVATRLFPVLIGGERKLERRTMASDQTARGEDFEKKAEKKLSGWGLFGSKYEDAADLYDKAANCFKLAKNWERAAAVYIKLAGIHIKLESKHEAASAYIDAANCYKKYSNSDAARALNEAVNLFLEIGRLNMAARYCKELGDSYEAEQDLEKAMDYFERAADLFQSEEVSSSVNQCKQRVAQIAAQLEQYPKAVQIYEEVARQSMNNNLLKYSVKGILLNAGICQLCKVDDVAITNSLERFQELDPTFSGTREYKLLADLAASIEEEDVEKFTNVIQEYDSMTRLDPWKTTLLLRVKNTLKEKEDKDEDLT